MDNNEILGNDYKDTSADLLQPINESNAESTIQLELSHADLELLIKNMISPFSYYRILYDKNGDPKDYIFVYVNDAFERETGLCRENIIGKRVLEVLPGTEKYWIERCGKVAKTRISDHYINYAAALNNWYETRIYSPQPDYFAMTVNNITDVILKQNALEKSVQQHQEAENNLFVERELLKTTLMSIGDGVICTDNQGKITMINEVAAQLTGWDRSEVIGIDSDAVFNLVNEISGEKVLSPIHEVIKSQKRVELGNHVVLISKDGKERAIADCASPIMKADGSAIGTVLVFRDVTDKKEKQKEIEYLGFHDQLTGLYNRRFFEEELIRLDTKRRLPVTVIVGDLNGLKFTNDAFGHRAGDKLLVAVSTILRTCLRDDDIICRYGGDEFVVILPNTSFSDAGTLISRITTMINETNIEKGLLSVAFGWATKKEPSEDIFKVLKKAEDNMYKKKLLETPSFRSAAIRTIENTLYEKNSRECIHSLRVSEICYKISEKLGVDENNLYLSRMAGRLHDIGKIILLDGIIDKPGKLTAEEWMDVKRHPEIGYRILCNTNEFSDISIAVLEHHERWDGKGYPKGIKGFSISLLARIISVADAFDAMTVDRPYRKALSIEAAIEEINNNSGKQFDPEIVEAFMKIDLAYL